jgi:hypothetical protein
VSAPSALDDDLRLEALNCIVPTSLVEVLGKFNVVVAVRIQHGTIELRGTSSDHLLHHLAIAGVTGPGECIVSIQDRPPSRHPS